MLALLLPLAALAEPTGMHPPVLSRVFGEARPQRDDVVVLRNGTRMAGKLINREFTLTTTYGEITIPAGAVAGVNFATDDPQTQVVVTYNYDRLSGTLHEELLQFFHDNELTPIRQDTVRCLLRATNEHELDNVDVNDKIDLLRLANGDLLIVQPSTTPLELQGTAGQVSVAFSLLREIELSDAQPPVATIKLAKGGGARGVLLSEQATFTLNLGTTLRRVELSQVVHWWVGRAYQDVQGQINAAFSQRPNAGGVHQVGSKFYLNNLGMRFRLIPASAPTKAAPATAAAGGATPTLTMAQPYYLGVTEVTRGQWYKVMGTTPSRGKDPSGNAPVDSVSWDDAQAFLKKLAQLDGVPAGTYRLPTPQEWQYAAAAGTASNYFFGDTSAQLAVYEWFADNSKGTAHVVAQLEPNPWDLQDMLGNVAEWCADSPPAADAPTGSARLAPGMHLAMGGTYNDVAPDCCVFTRHPYDAATRYPFLGFRILRSATVPGGSEPAAKSAAAGH